jgi:hypothetical protein
MRRKKGRSNVVAEMQKAYTSACFGRFNGFICKVAKKLSQ